MAIGDKAYRDLVPEGAREIVATEGLGELNRFSPGPESEPYYPDSIQAVLQQATAGPSEQHNGNGRAH